MYGKVLETAARLMLSEGRYDEGEALVRELRDRAAEGSAAATWQNILDALSTDAVYMRPDFGRRPESRGLVAEVGAGAQGEATGGSGGVAGRGPGSEAEGGSLPPVRDEL